MDLSELLEEAREEQGAEVWNTYRQYDPASLQTIMQYTQRILDALLEQGGTPDRDDLKRLLLRQDTAFRQLHLRVFQLADKPPRFGNLASEMPQWVRQGLDDGKVQDMVLNQFIQADIDSHLNGRDWSDLSRGEKSDVYDELEQKYPKSRSNLRDRVRELTTE